jgi:hypothetical protein
MAVTGTRPCKSGEPADEEPTSRSSIITRAPRVADQHTRKDIIDQESGKQAIFQQAPAERCNRLHAFSLVGSEIFHSAANQSTLRLALLISSFLLFFHRGCHFRHQCRLHATRNGRAGRNRAFYGRFPQMSSSNGEFRSCLQSWRSSCCWVSRNPPEQLICCPCACFDGTE